MRLGTIECARPRCEEEFTSVMSWNWLIQSAIQEGWTELEDEQFLCPKHSPGPFDPMEVWVVGCYTCDFEEEFPTEEEAKDEYSMHECEADTWIWSPDKVRARELRRETAQLDLAREREQREFAAKQSAAWALAQQRRLEEAAEKWFRLTNFFHPWKKNHL